jgi:hypothetical protein
MGRACSTYGGEQRCVKSFDGETWQKKTTWKAQHRWKDNIAMSLEDVGLGMDWIDLAQDTDRWRAVVNAVMNLRVP